MERGVTEYFFDTYALLAICAGRPSYERFRKVAKVTSRLNLMELHYILLRQGKEKEAERYYDFFLGDCIEIEDDVVKEANQFKLKNPRKDISYVDAIGYVYSLSRSIRFLTGDGKFEGLPGVEFVKE